MGFGMGFGNRWRSWIHSCVASLVNGSLKSFFKMEGGIRQGDHVSDYLCIMVAKALHLMLHVAPTQGLVHGFHIEHTDLEITHFHYADDTILFLKADKGELKKVGVILLWFLICSRLNINFVKSELMEVNLEHTVCVDLATVLDCKIASFPTSYLGISLCKGKPSKGCWDKIIEKKEKKKL